MPALRRMVMENRLSVLDFVYPIFVTHGHGIKNIVGPMPGVYQFSLDSLVAEAGEIAALGIPAVLLFGLPEMKNAVGVEAYQPNGIIQQAIKVIKDVVPNLLVMTDVCLCDYTDHGHCGVIRNGDVDNDLTLDLLGKIACSHAKSGADVVAPSSMMDGQVEMIRGCLDAEGFPGTPIMSYSAKYASAFYGPFRVAAQSTPQFGDRTTYQMDIPNLREALREIGQDIDEGADIVMVKPALAYLDVLAAARRSYNHPLAAYNVSGEYSMVKAAAENDWIDGEKVALEILMAIKRAGADIIITYHAKEVAGWLN